MAYFLFIFFYQMKYNPYIMNCKNMINIKKNANIIFKINKNTLKIK